MPYPSSSFQPNIIPPSLSSPPPGHLDTSQHDHPSTNIHFLDPSFPSHSPSIWPPSPSKTHSTPHLATHKGRYQRALAWWNGLPRIEESGYEEEFLYHPGMGTLAEEEQWRRKERRRGILEMVMLFGAVLILGGVVVVCLRMDGDGAGGGLDHGSETAMAMMAEMGLSSRE